MSDDQDVAEEAELAREANLKTYKRISAHRGGGRLSFPPGSPGDRDVVSQEARDVIHGLLQPDPCHRSTATALLQSTWLAKAIII